jgi:hypothetical protein
VAVPHDRFTMHSVSAFLRQNRHMWWPLPLPWLLGTTAARGLRRG